VAAAKEKESSIGMDTPQQSIFFLCSQKRKCSRKLQATLLLAACWFFLNSSNLEEKYMEKLAF